MKGNETNKESKQLNLLQKITLFLIALTIILYYVVSIQFLTS